MKQAKTLKNRTPDMVSIREAIQIAESDADQSCLPQTVYRTKSSYGWASKPTHARVLEASDTELHMTVLPRRYFHCEATQWGRSLIHSIQLTVD